MRPISQRENSNNQQKLEFQTKFKSRVSAHTQLKDLNTSLDSKFIRTQRSPRDKEIDQMKNTFFNKTASKLQATNFQHLDQLHKLQNDCNCGRHLGKFHVIKPDLTKNTIYQKSFYEQKTIPNIVNHDKEYDKLLGPHLELSSTYIDGFKGKTGDEIERPKPQDLLHSNGPCPKLSSYTSQFPGYRGDNQYVKPTDKHTRGVFPLRSKSTYANEFIKKEPKKDDYTYFPDQLKTGYNWFGKTTYENFYNNPNPQYFPKKVKLVEKLETKHQFAHQYETIYKNDFINKQSAVCPSKLYLETKAQGKFLQSKGKFAENSDFKAISPQFHAISTSKHSYV